MTRIHPALAALAGCLIAAPVLAAPGDHLWSDGWVVNETAAAMDDSGNLYMAGTFSGVVDFGGGTLTSQSGFDVFVVKMSSNGTHVWSAAFPPTFFVQVTAVGARPGGGVYVAGTLPKGGTIDFGGGPLGTPTEKLWAVHFDTGGGHVWSDTFGYGLINAIDATDTHVVFTGRNVTTVDFGGGALGATGNSQVIVAQLLTDKTHDWSAAYGDASYQEGEAVALTAAGDVVLLASVSGSADFGGGALGSGGGEDLVLVKLDSGGAHQWSHAWAGSFSTFGSIYYCGLGVHPSSGSIAITGEYVGAPSIGGGALPAASGGDLFVARYDASGNHLWSEGFGGAGGERGRSVQFDSAHNVIVGGEYTDTVDFGGGALALTGMRDSFVLALDTAGGHVWSRGFGSATNEYRCGVNVTPQDDVIADLYGGASVDFGGGGVAGQSYVAKFAAADSSGGPTSGPVTVGPAGALSIAPNPFVVAARIRFANAAGAADVSVYDAAGRRIRSLGVTEDAAAEWDGRTDGGAPAAPGVYFVRVATAAGAETGQVVRIR